MAGGFAAISKDSDLTRPLFADVLAGLRQINGRKRKVPGEGTGKKHPGRRQGFPGGGHERGLIQRAAGIAAQTGCNVLIDINKDIQLPGFRKGHGVKNALIDEL